MRLQSLLFAVLLAPLVACGGSSSSTPLSDPFDIRGRLEVPFATTIMKSEKGFLPATLRPAAGIQVQLWEIDPTGGRLGSALATAITSAEGEFALTVPAGKALGPQLVVEADLPTGRLSGQAIDLYVFVNPLTTIALQALTDIADLDDVTIPEVGTIHNYLEEFDTRAAFDTDDVSLATTRLWNLVIADRSFELLVFEAVAFGAAADRSPLVGTFSHAQIGFYTVAKHLPGVPQETAIDIGQATIADGGAAGLSVTSSAAIQYQCDMSAFDDGAGGVDYGDLMWSTESESTNGEEGPLLLMDEAGHGRLFIPTHEDAEDTPGTVDIYNALGIDLIPFWPGAQNSVFATSYRNYSDEYAEEAPGDPDLTEQRDSVHAQWLEIFVKQHAISNDDFDGTRYGYVDIKSQMHGGGGERAIESFLTEVSFTQTVGAEGYTTIQGDRLALGREASAGSLAADVDWSDIAGGDRNVPLASPFGPETDGYALDESTGILTLFADRDPEDHRQAFIGNGGHVIVFPNYDVEYGFADPVPSDAEISLGVGVRLGTSNPSVVGERYRIVSTQVCWFENGATMTARAPGNLLEFSSPTEAQVFGSGSYLLRQDDVTQGLDAATTWTLDGAATGAWGYTGTDGKMRIILANPDGDLHMDGWMSEDGSIGVFRLVTSELGGGGPSNLACHGIALLIREE